MLQKMYVQQGFGIFLFFRLSEFFFFKVGFYKNKGLNFQKEIVLEMHRAPNNEQWPYVFECTQFVKYLQKSLMNCP